MREPQERDKQRRMRKLERVCACVWGEDGGEGSEKKKARKVSKARSVSAVSTSVFLTHLVSVLNIHSMEHSLPKISNNLVTSSDKYFSRCLCDVTPLAPLQELTKEATSFS